MQAVLRTEYECGVSPLHRCDARVKLLLWAAYAVALFFVDGWLGLALFGLLLACALAAGEIAPGRIVGLSLPVLVLAVLIVVLNAFSPAGIMHGLFSAVRIVLLVAATLVVGVVTSSTDISCALCSFLRPLRALHVPVDDIAMMLSIALRFIPLMAEELSRIRDAQWSRGAAFGEGSLLERVKTWGMVLVPALVGMFHRADTLAEAMDARCYGVSKSPRTSLDGGLLSAREAALLAIGLVVCVLIAFWL